MRRQLKIGILPLYLDLYDRCLPETLQQFAPFLARMVEGFASRGVTVVQADDSRNSHEVASAVRQFERANVDLIVVLHLAYSPSLESADVLASSHLPILLFDTTMDADFGPDTDPSRIMLNHGIHGVMDLASVLRRQGTAYEILAGHLSDPTLFDRAVSVVRAARAKHSLRLRALRIGLPFTGMGDFDVPSHVLLDTLGVTVDQFVVDDLIPWVKAVTPEEVAAEMAADRAQFDCAVPDDVHARATRVGLGLRSLLDKQSIGAFSMNFLAFHRSDGPVETIPFLEACKAMARGIGYAGEGDVLTASLVGALAQGFDDVTFTEVFCPDWQGNSLFLSHMAEVNPRLAAGTPRLEEYDFPFTSTHNPVKVCCGLRPGPATFVNLAPGPHDTFSLLITPVDMLPDTANPAMRSTIRGWMRPRIPVADFLEAYSHLGGTHHSALVYGHHVDALVTFARFAGISSYVIG